MPTSEIRLPWPPPGLEPLRGRVQELSRRLVFGNVLILAALIGFSAIEPTASRGIAGPALLSLALAALGTLMFIAAAIGIWRVSREGGSSVWRGYTWLTILEVMADRRGDTGALIAGGDEFAELSAETRNGLRIARLVASFARFAAGLLPLPMFLLQSLFDSDGSSSMTLSLAISILPSLVLLAFASISGSAETVALKPHKEKQLKRFDRRADAIKLADEWYATFEDARHGQAIGRGPGGGVMRAWAVGAAAAFVIVAGAVVLMPVWFLVAVGSSGMMVRGIPSSTMARVNQVAYLRAYTPVSDSTITPQRAGDAFHLLAGPQGKLSYVKPQARTFPTFPLISNKLFPTQKQSVWSGPRSPDVLTIAKQGLNPAQRAYLAEVAGNPVWEPFGIVARAPRVDIAGGEYIVPFPRDVSPMDLAIVRFSVTRDLAYASVARAAYYLADGNASESERAIREAIAVGLHLIDDGNSSFDVLIGNIMVGIGQDALVQLYTLTNNPNLSNLVKYGTDARARTTTYSSDPIHFMNDRGAPRGVRIEIMRAQAGRMCGNIRGILFGRTSDERRMVAELRKQVARTPAEEALYDLNAEIVDRPLKTLETRSFAASALLFGSRLSGAVLGSPRLANCAAMVIWDSPSLFGRNR